MAGSHPKKKFIVGKQKREKKRKHPSQLANTWGHMANLGKRETSFGKESVAATALSIFSLPCVYNIIIS